LSAGNADLGLAGRVCWLPEQGFLHGSALIFRIVDGQADLGSHGPRNMPVWGYEFFGADADDEAAHGEATRKVESVVEFLRSIQRVPGDAATPHP